VFSVVVVISVFYITPCLVYDSCFFFRRLIQKFNLQNRIYYHWVYILIFSIIEQSAGKLLISSRSYLLQAMDSPITPSTANAILNILASMQISSNSDDEDQYATQNGHIRERRSPICAPFKQIHGSKQHSCKYQRFHRMVNTAPKLGVSKRRLSNSSDSSGRGIPSTGDHVRTDLNNMLNVGGRLVSRLNSNPRLREGNKLKKLTAGKFSNRNRAFFDPFDREALLKRIQTFNILNWTVYDQRLTPLECAVNGWRCHRKRRNELHCQGCHATILVRLTGPQDRSNPTKSKSTGENSNKMSLFSNFLFESDIEEEEEEAEFREMLVTSYVNRLHTEHYTGCIWKQDNLDMSLIKRQYYIRIAAMDRVLPLFYENLNALGQHQDIILSLKEYRKDIFPESTINALQEYTNYKYSPSILLIALLGWGLRQQKFGNKTLVLLLCRSCTRRILLGTVSNSSLLSDVQKLGSCSYPPPKELSDDGSKVSKSSYEINTSTDPLDEYGNDVVNLVKEHEKWCCIVGRYSSEDSVGYETVLEMLRSNSFSAHEEEMDEDLPSIDLDQKFNESIARIRSI